MRLLWGVSAVALYELGVCECGCCGAGDQLQSQVDEIRYLKDWRINHNDLEFIQKIAAGAEGGVAVVCLVLRQWLC